MRISLSLAFAVMIAVLAAAATDSHAGVPKRSAASIGGIAGNHPYFYRGSTGQAWTARHPVAYPYPSIHDFRFRVGDGRRIVIITNPWWRGYGYGHGYWGGYGWGHYGYSPPYQPQPVYYVRQAPANVAAPAPRPDGWALLKAGRHNEAIGRFAIDAQQGSALGNMGYALASALAGKHGDAAWAMRKAAEQNAAALLLVPTTDLGSSLDALAAAYESGGARLIFADDRWFLAAALHALRRDRSAAKAAIEKVKDDEKSTAALRSMLQ